MAGKQRKRKRCPRKTGKKKAKETIVVHQQVLPTETLADVFSISKRLDLDQWGVVSRQYNKAIERAPPLRIISYGELYMMTPRNEYHVALKCPSSREDEDPIWLNESSYDREEIFDFFFAALRKCYFRKATTFECRFHLCITIDRGFLDRWQNIKSDFCIRECYVSLGSSLPMVADVSRSDVVFAFEKFRALTWTSLWAYDKAPNFFNDTFLKSLASRGIWGVREFGKGGTCVEANGVTEEGILDYAFGEYEDDEEGRVLHLKDEWTNGLMLSQQFVSNLVQACRACKSEHKLDLQIAMKRDVDIREFLPIAKQLNLEENVLGWEIGFDDLPNVTIRYVPPGQPYTRGGILCWRNCCPP